MAAHPARAAGTRWVPVHRGTSTTCQEEAGGPRTGYYGCSSLEGGVGVCVTSQPDAAGTETVAQLEERGVE